MSSVATLGVDIGTSSSKGVLVDEHGEVLHSATRSHSVSRPHPGWVEMDADVWWDEFVAITHELLGHADVDVVAVGVSGMGPCVLLTDDRDRPVRPAILYGVDTRAGRQIDELGARFGADEILRRGGSALTSQAAGAKIRWVADEEPEVYARARRLYMPSSWLVRHLTGEYVLDHHSASQCTPLYDIEAARWHAPWAAETAPGIDLPPLRWAGETAGTICATAAERTGLPRGLPVITGTIDAWAEAISVQAHGVGDLMLMYGSTMFLVNTLADPIVEPSLWGPVGAFEGTRSLAGGMATTGALTSWIADLAGAGHEQLVAEAATSAAGSNGLLVLPYFAGERSPIMDPDARGVVAGLTLSHTRGDLYRAVLEATGFGVRHNVETMERAGSRIDRVVAVGGGTKSTLWPQIVSDISGRDQIVSTQTVGASYGGALLAARATGTDTSGWNPAAGLIRPDPAVRERYDALYDLYHRLYAGTADVAHALSAIQHDDARRRSPLVSPA